MWGRGLSPLNRGCPQGQRHPSFPPWPCGDGCLHSGTQQSHRQQAASSHTPWACLSPELDLAAQPPIIAF